jgi:head-tail adaptor
MATRNIPLGHVPLDPGERDRLVLIEQVTESAGASHFPVETWTALRQVYMRKRDQKGSERFAAGQLTAPQMTTWEMGYAADMDPETVDVPKRRRLAYQGRTYDIVDASQIGRHDGIELLTLAKVS